MQPNESRLVDSFDDVALVLSQYREIRLPPGTVDPGMVQPKGQDNVE